MDVTTAYQKQDAGWPGQILIPISDVESASRSNLCRRLSASFDPRQAPAGLSTSKWHTYLQPTYLLRCVRVLEPLVSDHLAGELLRALRLKWPLTAEGQTHKANSSGGILKHTRELALCSRLQTNLFFTCYWPWDMTGLWPRGKDIEPCPKPQTISRNKSKPDILLLQFITL